LDQADQEVQQVLLVLDHLSIQVYRLHQHFLLVLLVLELPVILVVPVFLLDLCFQGYLVDLAVHWDPLLQLDLVVQVNRWVPVVLRVQEIPNLQKVLDHPADQ